MPSSTIHQKMYRQALDCAVRLLARRAHACKEIENKLRQRNYNSKTITEVISECRRLQYLDDAVAAALFVAERKRKHYGPRHIKQAMQKRGFTPADIEKALMEGYSHDAEMKHARAAALKKNHQHALKNITRTEHRMLYSHLLYRGFSVQVIHQVLFGNNT